MIVTTSSLTETIVRMDVCNVGHQTDVEAEVQRDSGTCQTSGALLPESRSIGLLVHKLWVTGAVERTSNDILFL